MDSLEEEVKDLYGDDPELDKHLSELGSPKKRVKYGFKSKNTPKSALGIELPKPVKQNKSPSGSKVSQQSFKTT